MSEAITNLSKVLYISSIALGVYCHLTTGHGRGHGGYLCLGVISLKLNLWVSFSGG